jgi:hypothetical protein
MDFIIAELFAVKRDETPVFVVYGEEGTHALMTGHAMELWTEIYNRQTDEERQSAIGASMFGWDTPAANAAKAAMQRAMEAT